jgi:hypothetical protein
MTFHTNGLCSKWGFQDGEMLDEFLEAAGFSNFSTLDDDGEEQISFFHEVLITVVRDYVVPRLDQQVEVWELCGIHNPVVVRSVNGIPVDWRGSAEVRLTPETVEVADAIVLEIASRIQARRVAM